MPRNVEELINQVNAYRAVGLFGRAEILLVSNLQYFHKPNDQKRLIMELGKNHIWRGKHGDAREALEKALHYNVTGHDLSPFNSQIVSPRAECLD